RNPNYLPREFKFKTASAELMDLLAAPLYGNSPEIGVRELVQNAVDACRERNDLISKGIADHKITPENDVVVTLSIPEDGEAALIVEDYGVGMTPDVVDQYLLNIGASFRRSDAWRSIHEAEGHSTVHRTGRFGIGLLAAFLLGPEIRVTTRSISNKEESAITFTCRQGEESIEVTPCNFHFGTKIEILLSAETAFNLAQNEDRWDWYCLDSPSVVRVINTKEQKHLAQRITTPNCDSEIENTEWRRITANDYDDILWSYKKIFNHRTRSDNITICNGFKITTHAYRMPRTEISEELSEIIADIPSIAIFDPDGRLPINLQRDDFTGDKTGFEKELSDDISEFFTRKLIEEFEHLKPGINEENIKKSIDPKITGLNRESYKIKLSPVIISKKGIIPTDATLIRDEQIDSIVIDAVDLATKRGAYLSQKLSEWAKYYIAVPEITKTKGSRTQFIRRSIADHHYSVPNSGYFSPIGVIGRRILIRKADVDELVSPGNVPRTLWSRMNLELDIGNWGLWSCGSVPRINLDIDSLCKDLDRTESFGLSIIYFNKQKPADLKEDNSAETKRSPFSEAWTKTVRGPLLKQRPR
ncbi:MAG TPA: ATP-binding protein, partial [Stenomitos sp.]